MHSKTLHQQTSLLKYRFKDTVTVNKLLLSQDCTAFASCDPY